MKTNQYIEMWSEGYDGACARLRNVMRNLTLEQHMDMVLNFVDLKTLAERLRSVNMTTCVFRGKVNGWCRAQFIVSERADNGGAVRVIYCVANINAEKQHEEELLRLANTDALTGLNNRGHGEEMIRKLLEDECEGLFCLIDVDKFKQVNDTHGHNVGDDVLVAVAKALQRSTRGKDVIMRYGGDEFIVFMPGVVTEVIAERVMKRLVDSIDNIRIDSMRERVAVSIGAQFRGEGMSYEDVFTRADENLYRSKHTKGSSYMVC